MRENWEISQTRTMGKLKTPPNVDLRKFTIDGSLQQIRKSNFTHIEGEKPGLVEVWSCHIGPQQTKPFLKFVEETVRGIDPVDLNHIKRLRKKENAITTTIEAIICSTSLKSSKELLVTFLHENLFNYIEPDTIQILSVPRELPLSKDIAQFWSQQYWPVTWRGNPNHQDLITARFDITQEKRLIDLLINSDTDSQYPIRTLVARKDESTGKLVELFLARDSRETHPFNHSIMRAIDMVASDERKNRHLTESEGFGYLCHNLVFYTTHEPCTMCAMALVHSRIGRLTYIYDHPKGAIQSSFFIGDRRDLNWTFDIWRWVGDLTPDEKATNIDHISP